MRLLLVVVLVALGGTARAEPADEKRARDLYTEGQTHFDLAEFDDAVVSWKQAYELSKAPGLLYNIAQAHRLAGRCRLAERFYRSYLRLSPEATNRAKVESLITEVVACGENEPELEPEGGAPMPAVHPGAGLRLGGLVTAAVGLALVGTGVIFGVGAQARADELASLYETGGRWDASWQAIEDDGETKGTLAIVCYAAGGAVLATGVVLYYLGVRARHVTVETTAGGAVVGLTWALW
jgi:hypothetical protein